MTPVALRLAVCIASAALLLVVSALAVSLGATQTLDRSSELWVHQQIPKHLFGFMMAVTGLGESGSVAVIAFLSAFAFVCLAERIGAAFIAASAAGAGPIDSALKLLFHRARPHLWPGVTVIHSYSFPSGHATLSAALCTAIVYATQKRFGNWIAIAVAIPATTLVLLIGFSRVFLGVHWPSDVVAGYALGCTWALIVVVLVRSALARWACWRSGRLARNDPKAETSAVDL